MTPMEAVAAGLEQAEIGFITITEIPDAANFARRMEALGTVNPTEAEIADFLVENGFTLGQAQSLADGFDRIGMQAIIEGAGEVIEIYGDDALYEIKEALKTDRRFFQIANELYFVLENYYAGRASDSLALACKS